MGDLKAVSQKLDSFMKMSDRNLLDLTTCFKEFSMDRSNSKDNNHKHDDEHSKPDRFSFQSGDNHSMVPKPTQMDFPRFEGSLIQSLGSVVASYFCGHQHTLADTKLGAASFCLEGDAQLWFLKLDSDRSNLSWADFKSLLFTSLWAFFSR